MFIIKDLELHADGRAGADGFAGHFVDRRNAGLDKNFDAAVAALSALELGGQFEVCVAFAGDDVAATARFRSIFTVNGHNAVGDAPAVFGRTVGFGCAPAVKIGAVEQGCPTVLRE
jgi:hypothetical protein